MLLKKENYLNKNDKKLFNIILGGLTKMASKKKGQAGNLASYFAIFLGIVVVAYVFFILSDSLQGTLTANSTAYNATDNIIDGMYNATEQLPQAGTLIGVGVIIGVIALAIWGARKYGLF